MKFEERRNVLRTGPPEHPGETEITPAMVETVRQRIKEAGGILTVWAVLNEDVYETSFGDGFYLHVRGVALDSADAQRLADLAGSSELEKWHVRSYRLGLENDLPSFLALWRPEEEFTISPVRGDPLRNSARRDRLEAANRIGPSQRWPAAGASPPWDG